MLSRALKEHTANQSAIKEKQGNYNSEIILRTVSPIKYFKNLEIPIEQNTSLMFFL